MKRLKYKVYQSTMENGEVITIPKELPWTEANQAIARREAYNGEYTVEEDGVEEVIKPTPLDRIEAQVTYTAMMTDTLLEV